MDYLDDLQATPFDIAMQFDELPLWSAPFGLRMLEIIPMKPEQVVLDVGAGTGYLSIELAERLGKNSQVIALDNWPEAIDRLKAKAAFRKLVNLRTIVGDAASIPLDDCSIDLVVCCLGLNNFEDPSKVLGELHRVTRKGGELFFATNIVGHMHEFYAVFRAVLEECDSSLLPALDEHIAHRGTVGSIRDQLEAAGFERAQFKLDSFSMRFANARALFCHFLIRIGFLPAWKSIIPQTAQPRIFESLERRLDEVVRKNGELKLSIPMAVIHCIKNG